MKREALLAQWQQEEQQPFTGWDFSYLDGRMIEEQPPWSYMTRAAELMRESSAVVDLDTGGGERLLELQPHWPPKVAVTEEYPPNVKLATERLSSLGVTVVQATSNHVHALPFDDSEFDLILNRHGAFNAAECARILSPGGVFFTKQVHGLWAQDLLAAFGTSPQWPDSTPENDVAALEAAGFTIATLENWQGELRFTGTGAIVYYLKAVPWLVPGFTVATHQGYLFALQERLDAGDELVFEARTYLIEAQKTAHPG